MRALAVAATPAGSSLSWGVDINVGSGAPSIAGPSNQEIFTRRKDHVIDVDPTNPNHLTAAFVQVDVGFSSHYANSTDAGLTWSRGQIADPDGFYSGGNASIAYDGHGVAYLATLALSDTVNALNVYTSTSGAAWSEPVPIVIFPSSEYRFLPILALDKRLSGSNAGSAYIFYENYGSLKPFFLGVWGRYSRDGGRTWANEVAVSDPDHYYARGPVAVTGSDGTVYAAFEYRPANRIFNAPELYLDRSTDGGRTWGTDRLISGGAIEATGAPDWKEYELTLPVARTNSCIMIRINHYPSIAVSPTDSDIVYAAWNDGRWETEFEGCAPGSGRHSDIAFSKTTDGGLTWTDPIRINDDALANGVDQFMPTLQVAPDGTVGISFYDRRYDPDHLLYDLSYTQSADGGATWSANQRVSDVSSDPDRLVDFKGIDDIGFRKSLVYGPDYAVASWLDTRLGLQQGEFFIDRGTVLITTTPTLTPIMPSPTGTSASTPSPTITFAMPTATATPGGCALQFEDVQPGHTFYDFVRCLACLGILSGYPCGGEGEPCVPPTNYPYFRPSSNITRGQLSKVVSNAAGFSEPVEGQTFEDVAVGSTFYEFVERLAGRGVMSGYPCGGLGEVCVPPDNRPYFRPNANATRGQISKIVAIAGGLTEPAGERIFEDVVEGSTFYTYTQQLANLGVMSGYPCGGEGEPCIPPEERAYFRPNNQATRGQVSKIVSNTFFPACNP
jgi:hypothetical protein